MPYDEIIENTEAVEVTETPVEETPETESSSLSTESEAQD